MSEINYNYVYFDVLDYTNNLSLSSYALSACAITCRPRLQNSTQFSNKRVLWDFGDGTTSTEISASHAYELPGEYLISMSLYDAQGESYYNAYTKMIKIFNYIEDAIVLSAYNLNFIASDIENNIFDVYKFNSRQNSTPYHTIKLHVSGNNAEFISAQDYNVKKYIHLDKTSQFYQQIFNNNLQSFEYTATDSISTEDVKLFARLSGSLIVPCNSVEEGSFFVGTSGVARCAYRDDMPTVTSPTLIFATFDNIKLKDPTFDGESSLPNHSTTSQSFYCTLTSQMPDKLLISSAGILSGMQISETLFVNTIVPFVIQIATSGNALCKYYNNLDWIDASSTVMTANTVMFSLVDASTDTVITSAAFCRDFGTYLDVDVGIFKGYFSTSIPTTGAYLSACAYVYSDAYGFSTLSGASNTFKIIDNNLGIYKQNENYDQATAYKSYRFQETLLDKDIFFNDFLGTIVGDVSASKDALGKRIHEKQANFIDNTQFVDTCNIDAMYSLKEMIGADIYEFDKFKFSLPASISNTIDLLSIKQSKLWGTPDFYNENFDNKGLVYSTTYGINLGDELDTLTTILTAGSAAKNIVAYERFSGNYKLINTDLLSSSNVAYKNSILQTYALSSYNNYWGWGLILPNNFTPTLFDQYYKFYDYVETYNGDTLNSVINWDDSLNTLTNSQSTQAAWSLQNGFMDQILMQTIFAGLSLFAPPSGESPPLLTTVEWTGFKSYLQEVSTILFTIGPDITVGARLYYDEFATIPLADFTIPNFGQTYLLIGGTYVIFDNDSYITQLTTEKIATTTYNDCISFTTLGVVFIDSNWTVGNYIYQDETSQLPYSGVAYIDTNDDAISDTILITDATGMIISNTSC